MNYDRNRSSQLLILRADWLKFFGCLGFHVMGHVMSPVMSTLNEMLFPHQEYTFSSYLNRKLPACRRLLFPLLHAEKGRLRNAVANRVPASRWVPKILGTCCDRLTHRAHCLT